MPDALGRTCWADLAHNVLRKLYGWYRIDRVANNDDTWLVRTPYFRSEYTPGDITIIGPPKARHNQYWLLTENGGEVQVSRLNTEESFGIPYTHHGLPVGPGTLAWRIGLTLMGRHHQIDWHDLSLDDPKVEALDA